MLLCLVLVHRRTSDKQEKQQHLTGSDVVMEIVWLLASQV